MRLYSFVNANYLKHIQHGLQTAHAAVELYNKYPENTDDGNCLRYDILNEWARNHKTIIILDGGDCLDLEEIVKFFKLNDAALGLPWSYFKEDSRSLNNALTAVSVVVPAEIYDVSIYGSTTNGIGWTQNNYVFNNLSFYFKNTIQETFYQMLKSKGLAR